MIQKWKLERVHRIQMLQLHQEIAKFQEKSLYWCKEMIDQYHVQLVKWVENHNLISWEDKLLITYL